MKRLKKKEEPKTEEVSSCGGARIENIVWILAVLVIVHRLIQLGLTPLSYLKSFNENLKTMESQESLKESPEKFSERLLGLGSGFAKTDVKSAYRRLALKFHPDTSTGDETKFHQLVMAQNCLLTPEAGTPCEEIQKYIPTIEKISLPRLQDFSGLSFPYKYGPINLFRDYLISFGFTSLATAETGIAFVWKMANLVVERIVIQLFGGQWTMLIQFLSFLLAFRIAPSAVGLLSGPFGPFTKVWHILRSPVCFLIRRLIATKQSKH